MKKHQNIFKHFFTAILVVFLFAGGTGMADAQTWTPPTASPPGDNVASPLNTGSSAQSKIGGAIFNTGGATYGLLIPFGKVGIGTTSPSQLFSVAGIIYSALGGFKFPDGTIQTTAASGGSGGGDPSLPATAPTINSFTVSPATVAQEQNITVSGSAVKGSSCITQHRMYIVGSQGGVWTPVGCVSTTTLSSVIGTTQNIRSFFNGVGVYTTRWEVQDASSQITTREFSVTVVSNGNTGGTALEVGGNIKLSGTLPTYKITNIAAPTASSDVATKGYVDVQAAGGPASWTCTIRTANSGGDFEPVGVACSGSEKVISGGCRGSGGDSYKWAEDHPYVEAGQGWYCRGFAQNTVAYANCCF